MSDDYNIEDILLEAKKLREESKSNKKSSGTSSIDDVEYAENIARELMGEKAYTEKGSSQESKKTSPKTSSNTFGDDSGRETGDFGRLEAEAPFEADGEPRRKPLSFRRKKRGFLETTGEDSTGESLPQEKKEKRERGPLTFGLDDEIRPLEPLEQSVLVEDSSRKKPKLKGKHSGYPEKSEYLESESLVPRDKPYFKNPLPEIQNDPKFATGALDRLESLKLDAEEKPHREAEKSYSPHEEPEKIHSPSTLKERQKEKSYTGELPTRGDVEQNQPKLDLFDFKPKKREMPVRKGSFGQKYFDFKGGGQKPPPVPPNPGFKTDPKFDFASISGKIEEIQKEEYNTQNSVRIKHNPLDFTGAVNPIGIQTEDSKNKYAHLATKKDGRFQFGEKEQKESEFQGVYDSYDGDGQTLHPEDRGDTPQKKRRSIFSTFPTGTGKELNLDDIKQIDFGAVEGSGSGYYDDQDYYSGEDVPEGSFLHYNEFGPESDRRDVLRDISANKMSIFVRTAITAFLTIVLIYLGFAARYEMPIFSFIYPEKSTLPAFLLTCTIITALVGIVCGNTVISGIVSVFKMRANSDTLASFALLGAVFQGFIAFRNPELADPLQMNLYFPVAALAMLFNCIGKLTMLDRIQRNFRVTAAKQEKRGVISLDNTYLLRELMPQAHSKPTIALHAKADFFTDFMALSHSNKYDVGIHRSVAPVSLVGAIVVGLITRFLTSDSYVGATAFAGVLCISATFSSTFIESIPLGKLAKKITPMGAMVSGNKAVEEFCDTNAIALAEKDLFPKGHVYLNGIKAFPGGRIDEAILDAASVLCALDGSLSHVFLDMIGGNKQLLKKVDNVVYENNMGLSGWVDGRRVLIGNRDLMRNHGVELPSDTYERENTTSTPGNPIYLSNSGIVSARFQVEYTIDENLAYQLDLLAHKEVRLIVYTTDANINATKIWEVYGYPLDLISVIPSELQDSFREELAPKVELPAEIVYTGQPASMVAAILGTMQVRGSILSATIIQLAQIILGYTMVTLMSFMGYIGTFSMVKMGAYQLFWFIAILIIQQTRKP